MSLINLTENGAESYVFVSKSLSWKDARSYCKQFYTDLVSIHSQSENDEILKVITSAQAWIGLFRDSWKWSDGTNVSTSSFTWMTEQPEMTQLQRPCGVSDSGGMIRYQDCSSVLPFLCMQPGGAVSKNEGSENAGLSMQQAQSLQLDNVGPLGKTKMAIQYQLICTSALE
ncbi:hypothetical protein DNTS_006178 [Danionella cerebrum]|uniref:C-type lectin domain-containing protein n=1 Tax=Danionella cerebrum TaxID=2873325 RepID=A0A553N0T9_9TELE|nr:hypothetical protein DNTS_006178 [Danionella translucida]